MNDLPSNPGRKRAAILGAGGFVGSHLSLRLLERGWEIDGWDLDAHRLPQLHDFDGFRFHRSDLRDPAHLAAAVDAPLVVNLAALCQPARYVSQPRKTIEDNFGLSRDVALACLESKARLVQFSTSEVYGRTLASYLPEAPADDDGLWLLREDASPLILEPTSVHRWSYACSKQLVERFLMALAKEEGLEIAIVRPFNFLGPWMDFLPGRDGEGTPRVLASFLSALLDGRPFPLVDGGCNRRTFCSIHDATSALVALLERPEATRGQVFNLGHPGNECDMRVLATELAASFARVTGDPRWNDHPMADISSLEFYGEGSGDSDRRVPCIAKARRLLGWEPVTDLPTILDEVSRWALSHYSQKGSRP